jgi:hypothetical protein
MMLSRKEHCELKSDGRSEETSSLLWMFRTFVGITLMLFVVERGGFLISEVTKWSLAGTH